MEREFERDEEELVGLWSYDAGQFKVVRWRGNQLRYDEASPDGRTVSGSLQKQGKWYEGDVELEDSTQVGRIRIRYNRQNSLLVFNTREPGDVDWGTEVFARKQAPRQDVVSAGGALREPDGEPGVVAGEDLEEVRVEESPPDTSHSQTATPRTWSQESIDVSDFRLGCCCPCVVVGFMVRDAGLGRFWAGCAPVALLYVLVILFSLLPYLTGGGPCTFPNAQTETIGFLKVFLGECTVAEGFFLFFARIFWCGFAVALYVYRVTIANHLNLQSEGACLPFLGFCCCCHGCLLGTQLQTIREHNGAKVGTQKQTQKKVVGQPVKAKTMN